MDELASIAPRPLDTFMAKWEMRRKEKHGGGGGGGGGSVGSVGAGDQGDDDAGYSSGCGTTAGSGCGDSDGWAYHGAFENSKC